MRSTGVRGGAGAEARVLGCAVAAAGSLSLFTAAVPFSPTAPTRLAAALGATGLVLGVALVAGAGRVHRSVLHGVLAVATAAVTACVAVSTTPAGLVVTSYGYVWIAVFTAWFHPRRAAAAHVSGMGAGFAGALLAAGAVSPLQTWVFVMSAVGLVAASLNVLVGRLRANADRDQLTGLLNRTAFASAARHVLAGAVRSGEPVTLALLDLDDFKQVNDTEGHARGDRLLVTLAACWSSALRRGDLLGRHGGDEFVLLLPSTGRQEAEALLARLRAATPEGSWTVGTARWEGEDLDAWLARADADLYARKRARPGGGAVRMPS